MTDAPTARKVCRAATIRGTRARRSRATVEAAALGAAILWSASCAGDQISSIKESGTWTAGTASHDVGVRGVTRTFLLHVPPAAPGGSIESGRAAVAYPLVLVLHGSSGSAADIEASSHMDSLADARGFVVAYPNGSEGGFGLYPSDWNAGQCCGAAAREGVDDLAFLSALIARVESALPIDASRIYIAGFSDGGRMAYHAACRLPSTFAAIAVISGSLVDDRCQPGQSVPVIAFHGTADAEVSYDEATATPAIGPIPESAAALPPAAQFWVAQNNCAAAVAEQITTNIVRTAFDPCSGAAVVVYTIEGGTHGWPGAPGSDGPMTELHASQVITDFFARYTRR